LQRGPGTLYVVATPIGNLDDLSPRALRVLSEVPVLACEDTRRTGMLLKRLGVVRAERRYLAYHEHNEVRVAPRIVSLLRDGLDVALVTNAGTPLVSDPGYRLVAAARREGLPVVPIPGPCAAIAALCASGLPTDRFTFLGFLPARASARARVWADLREDRGTCIFYVPARSLERALVELSGVHPDARVVVARELTKVFEEFVCGTPEGCLQALRSRRPRGEVTLLVHRGARKPDAP